MLTSICGALVGATVCLLTAGFAIAAFVDAPPDPMGGVVLVTFAVAGGWLALRSLTRLRASFGLVRRGAAYAIADDALMLVGPSGRVVIVHLDRITALAMQGDEPRLYTDFHGQGADGQGLVHATMFELFDSDGFGPSGERFFERLAVKLRARSPDAAISRGAMVDAGLIHEHP
jgi:hypothetical protein